jgi:hypothetical protein
MFRSFTRLAACISTVSPEPDTDTVPVSLTFSMIQNPIAIIMITTMHQANA